MDAAQSRDEFDALTDWRSLGGVRQESTPPVSAGGVQLEGERLHVDQKTVEVQQDLKPISGTCTRHRRGHANRRHGGRVGGRSMGPVSGRTGRHGPCGRVIRLAFWAARVLTGEPPSIGRSPRGSLRVQPRGG